ncbi:hypothetical protein [Halobaculum gomorrense]|uniref:Uncharacterized protein n=1 Tax=Halobaculum gomorrense TaxID=43928 RepID=A0A1M5UTD0_9EURY|nr:hypothetical protein [Halobaculum gomorrense]SHH66078.1 hypothetical protein SAMN05443636_3124 [Halobaculum gomorrense]
MSADIDGSAPDPVSPAVDWPTFFAEHDLHGSGIGQVVMWLDGLGKASSEAHAETLVTDAVSNGELVANNTGYYPAGAAPTEPTSASSDQSDVSSKPESPEYDTDTEAVDPPDAQPGTPAVSEPATELVSSIESMDSSDLDGETVLGLLGECASVIEQQARELEQKDEQIAALESEVEAMTALNEAVGRRAKRNNHAVFQLQVRELQSGATLPADQVDVDALRDDLGLDVEFVGEDEQYVRLDDPEAVGDGKNRGAEMPDSDELCQAEQWRQMYRRSFITQDDLTNSEYRAMRLWDDLAKLAVDGGTYHFVTSAKAKAALVDGGAGPLAGMTPDSKNTATNRTMKALANDHAAGVVETVKRDGSLRLRFDLEELKDAQKPLYQSAESDTGDVLVGT